MVLGKDVAYGVELYTSRSRETAFAPGTEAYRLRCIPLKVPAAGLRSTVIIVDRSGTGRCSIFLFYL